jgi:hypothetical protein
MKLNILNEQLNTELKNLHLHYAEQIIDTKKKSRKNITKLVE